MKTYNACGTVAASDSSEAAHSVSGALPEREYRYDNLKAFLIFCVVLGHVLKRFGMSEGADALYLLIFSFHMPAFLFVSGYFAKYNPKRVLGKLLPLYLVFQCVQFLLDPLMMVPDQGWQVLGEIHFQLFTPRWTLWYLMALMIYQLLLPLFEARSRAQAGRCLAVAAALGLFIGCNPDTDNFMALARVFHFLPIFLLGYYERRWHLLSGLGGARPALRRAAAIFLTAVLCTGLFLFHRVLPASWFYGTESYGTDGFTWFVRLGVWLLALVWIWIFLVLTPGRRLGVLESVGRNTLPVYLLHTVVLIGLSATMLPVWLDGNLPALVVLALFITYLLSRECFARAVNCIRFPKKR